MARQEEDGFPSGLPNAGAVSRRRWEHTSRHQEMAPVAASLSVPLPPLRGRVGAPSSCAAPRSGAKQGGWGLHPHLHPPPSRGRRMSLHRANGSCGTPTSWLAVREQRLSVAAGDSASWLRQRDAGFVLRAIMASTFTSRATDLRMGYASHFEGANRPFCAVILTRATS